MRNLPPRAAKCCNVPIAPVPLQDPATRSQHLGGEEGYVNAGTRFKGKLIYSPWSAASKSIINVTNKNHFTSVRGYNANIV